jgi:hypothetical protein
VIAGTNDLVTPKATADAVFPAFVFFAACSLVVGLCFTLVGIETHGKPLAMDVGPEVAKRGAVTSPRGREQRRVERVVRSPVSPWPLGVCTRGRLRRRRWPRPDDRRPAPWRKRPTRCCRKSTLA